MALPRFALRLRLRGAPQHAAARAAAQLGTQAVLSTGPSLPVSTVHFEDATHQSSILLTHSL